MSAPALVLVTDPRWSTDRVEAVIGAAGAVLRPGALAVQLRDKAAPPDDLARTAARLRAATSRARALFVVNAATREAMDVAVGVASDGVHVPCRADVLAEARARLGLEAFISTPAHSDEDVVTAGRNGASAALVSPIFASPGKGAPRGLDALRSAREVAGSLRIIALGGVDATNAAACAAAGAEGVAVIRALLDAADVGGAAWKLAAPFSRGK